ncbi:probable truncated L-gulonolactone oxidase 7, mitochondrial [Gossypium hirsutum]|uniref:Probable truncated L-gulonolactone oxidase 7, mitochondrial n=1 Tax=Gossypium hirsutum TaxID=3635 RepID=A0A1U8KTN9_GOSHI|nr:probable truncated L-gulonolactone oxidase 7, mitochondrial [Gossypium hirsutum]
MDPKSLCGLELYNSVLMHYVKASSAYLGKQEYVVDFDITCYKSKDPMAPKLYQDVLEKIEQMALFKYDALPHWGKNQNLVFDGVIKRYKNGGEFLKVKNTNRPLRLFSSEWTNQNFGMTVYFFPRCLLCSKQGLSCRPGKTFTDARVCIKN